MYFRRWQVINIHYIDRTNTNGALEMKTRTILPRSWIIMHYWYRIVLLCVTMHIIKMQKFSNANRNGQFANDVRKVFPFAPIHIYSQMDDLDYINCRLAETRKTNYPLSRQIDWYLQCIRWDAEFKWINTIIHGVNTRDQNVFAMKTHHKIPEKPTHFENL